MANQKVNYVITGENQLSKVLTKIDSDAQKAESSVNGISKKSGNGLLGSIVGGNLLASGISKIGGLLAEMPNQIVDSLTNYEYFSTSLKTMMHGDVQMAKALEGQLVTLAKTTPFSLVDVQNGTKQLMAYGFAGSEIVGTMKTLGNVASGVGKPLNEVAYLYGTLKTQGRAFSKDINQFTSAGIPIVKELAKQFGVTENSVMKLVEAGKVGFPEVEKAFKSMTAEGGLFFNLMDEQSQTVGGKISAFGDIWEQIRVNIGKSQKGIIASTLQFATDMSATINNKLAAGNFMDEAFKQGGAKEYSSTTEFYGNLSGLKNIKGLAGNFAEMKDQAMYMQSLIEQASTGKGAQQSLQYINLNREKLNEKYKNKEVNSIDYNREMSLYSLAYKEIIGNMKLLKSKEEKIAGTDLAAKEKASKEKLGTGVTIESQAPKNQYITINGGLVHEMNIESMDGSTPVSQIKEQVSTVLIELLNDAYQAQR
ncbi:Caudovirus, tape measure, N-terminal [uncultured Caudovirales phage]|uniref:Caudovirus, tape measure, N-terminal n=1 Tax=uncultured Caudovirales phage TaxID=2100421 RepID=A0A6J5L0A7_9CAUD|nr:Caudovirus, tape measure, N-terminal [uncultured Caudovirales phage]